MNYTMIDTFSTYFELIRIIFRLKIVIKSNSRNLYELNIFEIDFDETKKRDDIKGNYPKVSLTFNLSVNGC